MAIKHNDSSLLPRAVKWSVPSTLLLEECCDAHANVAPCDRVWECNTKLPVYTDQVAHDVTAIKPMDE